MKVVAPTPTSVPTRQLAASPPPSDKDTQDEVVFGKSREQHAATRARTWSRIGGVAGAIPGLGVAATMFGASVANTGLENKARETHMPFLTAMVGVGAVAASALHIAGVASLFLPQVSTATSALLLTAGCVATGVSSASSFYIAGHHNQNWGQLG